MSSSSRVEMSSKRKSVTKFANSDRNSSSVNPVVCGCGIVAPMWEAWKEGTLDPGRRFVGCSRYKDANMYCRFFKWCDPPCTERSREVIKKLRYELIAANEEIQRLRLIVDRSDSRVVKELKMENVQKASKLKKIWLTLICSWLIFVFVLLQVL